MFDIDDHSIIAKHPNLTKLSKNPPYKIIQLGGVMSDFKWPKADSPCFDPATNSLAILTKSMLPVKCLCSCLERSLSLAKFTFGEEK